jgi:hypothetical protein
MQNFNSSQHCSSNTAAKQKKTFVNEENYIHLFKCLTTRVNNGNAEGTFGVMAAQKKSMVTLAKIKLIDILFISICLSNRKS